MCPILCDLEVNYKNICPVHNVSSSRGRCFCFIPAVAIQFLKEWIAASLTAFTPRNDGTGHSLEKSLLGKVKNYENDLSS